MAGCLIFRGGLKLQGQNVGENAGIGAAGTSGGAGGLAGGKRKGQKKSRSEADGKNTHRTFLWSQGYRNM